MEHYRQPDSINVSEDLAGLLGAFSLTRLEASVYLGLCLEGPMNGYEAAKRLGISRSNAYNALAALVAKGAAWTTEAAAIRYAAVSPGEFCANHLRALTEKKEQLLAAIPAQKQTGGGYFTIRGKKNVLNRLRHMLGAAKARVYLAVAEPLLSVCIEPLRKIAGASGKIVVVTDAAGRALLGNDTLLLGATVYETRVPPDQLRAIVDSTEVLTGDLGQEDAECLYSDQKNLADIFKSALKNEIRLIELGVSPEET